MFILTCEHKTVAYVQGQLIYDLKQIHFSRGQHFDLNSTVTYNKTVYVGLCDDPIRQRSSKTWTSTGGWTQNCSEEGQRADSVSVKRDQPVKGDIHDQPIDLTWPHIIISSLDQNQTQSATPALLIPALLVGFTTTSFRWTVLVELNKFFILKWKRYTPHQRRTNTDLLF